MRTCDEIANAALARCREFSVNYPAGKELLYTRIGTRQQQLVELSVMANADYFGVEATADLDSGVLDLSDMPGQVDNAGHVQKVTIENPGTSGYPIDTEVAIVPLRNIAAAIAPRAVIRDGLLIGVGSDLDLVTTLRVYYTKLPAALGATDKATEVVIPDPHAELLVLDLCQYIVNAAPQVSATVSAAVQAWAAEEASLEKAWLGFLSGYSPVRQQFSAHVDVATS